MSLSSRAQWTDYRSKGSDLWELYFFMLLATAFLKHGAIEDGFRTVRDGLNGADQTGSQIWNAEFHRLRGELLLARDPADASEAEAAFHEALVIARGQSAKSWELRTALSLSRLWRRQGKREEAGRLLRGIRDWFTEGFEAADLREARTPRRTRGGLRRWRRQPNLPQELPRKVLPTRAKDGQRRRREKR